MLFARSSALPKMLPILGAVLISSTLLAADDLHDLFTQGPTPLQRELKPISERIQAKILAGAHDRKLFTNELNAIEEVLRRYPAERPEKLAEVRYGLAIGHWKLFNDPTRAIQLLEQLKRDFPQTTYAPKAASDIEAIPKIDAGNRMRASIALGKPFPDFEVRDMSDQPLSTTSCRGKPVLILSWKVSTAPYLQFDRLLALQRKYEPNTFEVIGVNMDEDEKLVRAYLQRNGIPWRQYFDGRGVRNELGLKYNLGLACYEFVLDREGRVTALAPNTFEEVEQALVKALKVP